MDLDDEFSMTESIGYKESNYTRNSEKSGSPVRMHKYKCYSCGGDGQKSKNCDICHKMKFVNQNNPLVQLLGEIMNKKFGVKNTSFASQELPRDSLKKHFSEIREQAQLADDKAVICDNCNKEGEITDFKHCKECGHFYLCKQCIKQGVMHEHPLTAYCQSEDGSSDEMKCSQCQRTFGKQLFLICQTCLEDKKDYKLCQKCSRKKKKEHSSHIFQPNLNQIFSKERSDLWLDEDNEVGSSEIIEEDNEESFSLRQPVRRQARESLGESSKDNSLHFFDQSKIKLQVKGDNNVLKATFLKRTESINHEEEEEQKYIFQQYICDMCNKSPQNYRYHCKKCQDYDLCQECYKKREHSHTSFIKIGKKEQEQLIEKQKLQSVDKVQDIVSAILKLHDQREIK